MGIYKTAKTFLLLIPSFENHVYAIRFNYYYLVKKKNSQLIMWIFTSSILEKIDHMK